MLCCDLNTSDLPRSPTGCSSLFCHTFFTLYPNRQDTHMNLALGVLVPSPAHSVPRLTQLAINLHMARAMVVVAVFLPRLPFHLGQISALRVSIVWYVMSICFAFPVLMSA